MTKGTVHMKRGSTIFLRGVIYLIGAVVLALCIFVLPRAIASDATGLYPPIIYGMYITTIPLFYALFNGLALLGLIDRSKAFSHAAVATLRNIKFAAFVISALYLAGLPYIYYAADKDDAPGVMALGCVIVFASFVIGVAAAVFQRLFLSAVIIKTENDLTV